MTIKTLPVTVQYIDENGKKHIAPGARISPYGKLDILDQTLLPQKVERLELITPEGVYDAIKRLCVRGAPAIGCSAAVGLAVCAARFRETDLTAFCRQLEKTAEYLKSSRPTAVNLMWAVDRCCAAAAGSANISDIQQRLLDEALAIMEEDAQLCRRIGEAGAELLQDGMTVLTHCNAGALATCGMGTALAPIYRAMEQGKKITVYSDETRPLLQGARLTAWELAQAGVETYTICDNMAASVMAQGKIDMVIVGADRIAANGDSANKIGTYQVAIAAKYHNIPFYIAAPYSTIDYAIPDGSCIPIEERKSDEIFHCSGVKVFNPAFDVTPKSLITAHITERGVLTEL
ncbi:MAG: S-methyl-5-thioribose-1-phosphate isomerase [Lentisphaeria bacterium]|nr:S-methyl-5-thioribose-1-phosphate isomerase [Lentisphaeria bacterium]